MANNPINELHNTALATIAAAQSSPISGLMDHQRWLATAAHAVRQSQKTIAGSTTQQGKFAHHDAVSDASQALMIAAGSVADNWDRSHYEKLHALSRAFGDHADNLLSPAERYQKEQDDMAAMQRGINFTSRSVGEQVFGGGRESEQFGTPEKLAAGVESLRQDMINEGHPFPKKIHKAADKAIDAINRGDFYEAHDHIDRLHDEAYNEMTGPEMTDRAEALQEAVGKLY